MRYWKRYDEAARCALAGRNIDARFWMKAWLYGGFHKPYWVQITDDFANNDFRSKRHAIQMKYIKYTPSTSPLTQNARDYYRTQRDPAKIH